MTRDEAIQIAPVPRREYKIFLCWHLLIATGAFAMRIYFPGRMSWIWIMIGAISLSVALQAAERLLMPLQAARRSQSFSQKTASRLRIAGRVLSWTLFSAGVFLFFLNLVRSKPTSMLPLLFVSGADVAWFFQDLLGVKVAPVQNFEHSPPLQDLQPLHSTHWGEAPSSRLLS